MENQPINTQVSVQTREQKNASNAVPAVTPTVKQSKPITGSKLVAIFIVTVVLSVLVGAGSMLLVFHFYPDITKDSVTNVTRLEKEVTVTDEGIADAVEKIYDSVVIVKNYKRNQLQATGTGFVYKKYGNTYYLITNHHVIEGGDKITVVFTNNKEETVEVKGSDLYADIAVLSLNSSETIAISKIGSSVDARVGDTVFAIGSPLDSNVYSWSVTRGVLSGKDREVEVSTTNSNKTDWIMQVLQTDAAINSGNSGGPLCNSNGEVIGINNMKLITSGVEGMGFAIPIEEAILYSDAVINGKQLSRPVLGIRMADDYQGVMVDQVDQGSLADKAGLKKGDVITALGGVKIKNVAGLRYQLYKYTTGDTLKIEYLRNGRTYTTKVKITD